MFITEEIITVSCFCKDLCKKPHIKVKYKKNLSKLVRIAYDEQKKLYLAMDSYSSYLNWIDSQEQILLLRIKQWVAINTFSLNIKGLRRLSRLLRSSFKILGGKISIMNLPPRKILCSDGHFNYQPLGPALIIRKRDKARIRILLGGHFDTVYSPTHSFQNIEEFAPNIWKGPGIADMKGGIAILLTALEAFERFPLAKKIGWEILLTPDEEIGSPGSKFLYKAAAQRHQCGLIFEPGFPDGSFVNQRKGSITYTIVIYGKASHVGRDYSKTHNAVFALVHFIQKLENLHADQEVSINVADIEGKGPVNVVPPLASCRINFRTTNTEVLNQIPIQIQQLVKESQQEGVSVETMQDSFQMPKHFDTKTQCLFKAYANCAQDLNIPFHTQATGGVCDGNILAEAGLPTLDTAGAIGGSLHTPDEYLICSSLIERAKLAALFLFKLATGEITMNQG